MPIYIIELDGKQYDIEGDRPPDEKEARQAIGQFNESSQPEEPAPQPEMQRQSLGRITNVPGATSRAAIQSNPALALAGPFAGLLALGGLGGQKAKQEAGEGALRPDDVPMFQDQAIQLGQNSFGGPSTSVAVNFMKGLVPSAAGLVHDMRTDPLTVLTSLIGTLKPAQMAGSAVGKSINEIPSKIKPFLKWDKVEQQANMAKGALDALKKSYGSIYDVALQPVQNVTTKVDFGKMPRMVLDIIKNKKNIYEVEFNANGSIKNTIGNVSKIKRAANEIVTPALRESGAKTEIKQIENFAGYISGEMRKAAKGAGRPIDEAMDMYGDFRKNYDMVNGKLLDKNNNAMANKLKALTRLNVDRTIRESQKVLAKESPEFKAILDSRKNREVIKLLLKSSPYLAGAEGARRFLTGQR